MSEIENDNDPVTQLDLFGGEDEPVLPGVELDEILNADVEWVGLPAFIPADPKPPTLVLTCETEADRADAIEKLGVYIAKKTRQTWSAWYPPREQEDLKSLRFDFGEGEGAAA